MGADATESNFVLRSWRYDWVTIMDQIASEQLVWLSVIALFRWPS
jgi:hypothetical protein